ncbi:MAG: TIM barrel protein [bacterium]|nr:TIM barrel protein [bacterium]
MPVRIAIVSDLHLPDTPGSPQHAVWEWAVSEVAEARPDAVLVPGDMTGAGEAASGSAIRHALDRLGVPCWLTPGNSDRRSPSEWRQVGFLLSGEPERSDAPIDVLTIDSSLGRVTHSERERAETLAASAGEGARLILTHYPPDRLAGNCREWFRTFTARHGITCIVAGHVHVDESGSFSGVPLHVVRGLDPDKAAGGPPAVTFLECDGDRTIRREATFPDGDVAGWSNHDRRGFLNRLGISCMHDTLTGLDLARRHDAPVVELRATDVLDRGVDRVTPALEAWRAGGGRRLSVHMPGVQWDVRAQRAEGLEAFRDALRMALDLECQALTVHVPGVPVGFMKQGGRHWIGLLDAFGTLLKPALDRRIRVGIENMHMTREESHGPDRGFGYLPGECLAWVQALRESLGTDRIGFHLDIGHARNNDPYAKRIALGPWYARTGAEIVAYHLHQVVDTEEGMVNHRPFTTPFGKLISLSSLLWGWWTRALSHAPMYLEMETPQQAIDSLLLLRRHVAGRG